MDERKPLPDLPPYAHLTTLSTDARNHRTRFIRHILSEIDDPGLDKRLNDWTRAIEDALDDLTQYIGREEWLAGFRTRKETLSARQNHHLHAPPPPTSIKSDKSEGSKEGHHHHPLLKGKSDSNTAASASWTTISSHSIGGSSSDGTSSASSSPGSEKDEKTHVLTQMQKFASLPGLPSPNPIINHLVLCVAPFGTHVSGVSESGALRSPGPQVGCVFTPSVFSNADAPPSAATVLYGLGDWESTVALSERTQLHVVGGTFVLIGATSASQHQLLIPVLRAAIYMHLALILEQHLFSDLNVHLEYPRPNRETHYPSEPQLVSPTPKSPGLPPKSPRGSGIRSTLFHLFSKRALNHRSSTISSVTDYPGTTELSRHRTIHFPRKGGDESSRTSLDSIGQRIRRFSIRGDAHIPVKPKKPAEDPSKPFSTVVSRIENSKSLLSTSFDVSFRPPEVLLNLAQSEEQDSARRSRGKERCGLSTLLGWDTRDQTGRGMSGLVGFVRHQSLSVLVSRHVLQNSPPAGAGDMSEGQQGPRVKSLNRLSCGRPRWKTFWYYAKGDHTLGEVIIDFSSIFSLACDEPGCTSKCGEHRIKFTHGKACVEVSFSPKEQGPGQGGVVVWSSCAICEAKSSPKEISHGTFLLSFAKYLELLIYSAAIHSSSLCEHTKRHSPDESEPSFRFNFLRHFSTDTCHITFALAEERDIFQMHLPRLQICRTGDKLVHPMCPENCQGENQAEEERSVLRRQIRAYWEAVSDHLDKIEALMTGPSSEAIKKALPRLPSVTDDAYEEIVASELSTTSTYWAATNHASNSLLSNDSNLMDPVVVRVSRAEDVPEPPTMTGVPADPHSLLLSMRYSLQRVEQSLYAQLSHTPIGLLNDVRWAFLSAGRGAQKRISAWKKKHLLLQQEAIGELNAPEPEWWDKKCHPLPGGNVVIQEEDWGSIIAFTLSSSDFLHELCNTSFNRSTSTTSVPTTSTASDTTPSPPLLTPSAASAVTTKGYKFFSNSAQAQQPDPDKDDVVWHESESYAAVVTRKEVSRDSASLLSIRDMLRSRMTAELGASGSRTAPLMTPPSAWAKPDVRLSMEAAGGEVAGLPDTVESAGRILQELEAFALVETPKQETASPSSSTGRAASRISRTSTVSDATASAHSNSSLPPDAPPDLPPKDRLSLTQGSTTPMPATPGQPKTPPSLANTFTNSLNYALRFISSGQSVPRVPGHPAKAHHGLLHADCIAVDERPHIKYEAMVGKHLKISCTVYYAKQFDLLRKRCGVDDVFVKSLSRSSNWQAEGGKSKAHFWKTSDDRFVIKTLVNAWNVYDLHVLQELAPACFQYVESSASRPTVLVKLLGYYTIEVKNQESGVNHGRIDLVVMENVFYDRKVDKMFDLKGIQGRKVKPTANDLLDGRRRQTLFDGEWIEGQQKTLMLVRPESKKVLREAVRNDADFLARMNIMDYSLLLGIDVEGKHITCGLVDTIGSYTLAKTLEYKAKHGLHSTKDVTVIPPAEYEERFVNALEGYFVACPDKWSKPLDESRVPNSAEQLPSVL